MSASPDSAEVERRAQERLDLRRAANGINSRPIARLRGEETPQRELEANPAQKERPGDVLLREVERDVERRAASRAPGARAFVPPVPTQSVKHAPAADTSTGIEEADSDDALGKPLPVGDFVLGYKRTDVGHAFGREFWIVHFVVAEGEHAGRIVPRFYNPPRGRLARSSNLWRDFVALTGKRPPSNGFGPAWLLKDCRVVARVAMVKDRPGPKGKRVPMAECEWYSRVESFVRIESGQPPVLAGSCDTQIPKAARKKKSSS